MARPVPDLWPDDLEGEVLTPLAIMQHQADQLAVRTSHVLNAAVSTTEVDGELLHKFEIVAPVLDGYRHLLFTVAHDRAMVYPAKVITGSAPYDPTYPWPRAETQHELFEQIGNVLRLKDTRAVLHALLASSSERASSGEPP